MSNLIDFGERLTRNSYEAGDVAVITPQNIPEEIDIFLNQMGWAELAEKWITIRPADDGNLQLYRL